MIFLAPVPVVHVQSMFDDIKEGYSHFAFGSQAWEFFDKIEPECKDNNILALIYVSKTGEEHVKTDADKRLGICVQGRLLRWVRADRRRQYSGLARRPPSTINDRDMSVFWEIDSVERLTERLPISDFLATNAKPFSDSFIPQGPMLINRKR